MFYETTAYKYILYSKQDAILQSGKIAHFAKAIKIIQKITLNTHERCLGEKWLKTHFIL